MGKSWEKNKPLFLWNFSLLADFRAVSSKKNCWKRTKFQVQGVQTPCLGGFFSPNIVTFCHFCCRCGHSAFVGPFGLILWRILRPGLLLNPPWAFKSVLGSGQVTIVVSSSPNPSDRCPRPGGNVPLELQISAPAPVSPLKKKEILGELGISDSFLGPPNSRGIPRAQGKCSMGGVGRFSWGQSRLSVEVCDSSPATPGLK